MKLHRFIADLDFDENLIVISDLELLNQWRNVLRLGAGDEVILSDGKLGEARVKILKLEKDLSEVEILEKWENEAEPTVELTLYLSLLKKGNFEWAAEKVTEIGVKRIVPVITERTVKLNLNKKRLEKIVKEAAEQSGRGIIPKIGDTMDFKEALGDSKKNNDIGFIFEPGGNNVISRQALDVNIAIFIGPEGGWSEKELDLAKLNGLSLV